MKKKLLFTLICALASVGAWADEDPVILNWGTNEPWQMKFVKDPQGGYDDPQPGVDTNELSWTQPGYDDSSWGTLTGPMANGDLNGPIVNPNYTWEGENHSFCMRRTFTLDNVNNDGYTFVAYCDDQMKVYVNGQIAFELEGASFDARAGLMDASLFHTGENLLSICYLAGPFSHNFLDYSLFSGQNYTETTSSLRPIYLEGLWYNLNLKDQTAEVITPQDDTPYSGSIVIPETIYGKYAVTSIGDDAFSGSEIETITIPSSITTIGGRAFDYCEKLEKVYITDLAAWCRIDFIDYGAGMMDGQGHSNPLTYAGKLYLNGTRITGLIIPESITEIKDNAFRGGKFTSLTIPNTVTKIGEYAFEGCSTLRTAKVSNTESECYLTAIGHDAFYGCSALQSVNFTESVTELGEFAFAHCGALTEVKLNDNLTNILSNTFLECGSLTTINIPNSITSIGNSAFEGCGNLSIDLVLPAGLTTIGDRTFANCYKLATLRLPNTLTTIGENAFAVASSLPSLYIPSSVTSIGGSAFVGLKNATSIIVDEDNTEYDSRGYCNALIETRTGKLLAGCQNTIIPDGVTSLENSAFCFQPITFVILPNSVETIKEGTFSSCDNLKTIVFGTGVTDIDRAIHYACVPDDIYCYNTEVPMADGDAWHWDGPLDWPRTLHVPAESIEDYRNTAPWNQIPTIVPITGDEHFADIDVTIGAAGYATFSNGYTLDFTGIEGLTAYVAKGDKSQLTYETVGAVPAGTGLLLAGEEGTYQVPVIYSAAAVNDNLLVGTGLKPSTTLEAGDYLLQNDPVDGIGFYRGEGKTLGAGKAYLHIDGGYDVKSFRLPDIPTSIHSIEAKQVNSVIYNLAGQRVQTPARGLYIVNGKKIAIK